MYEYRAELLRIIDGDTQIYNVDCGFDIWHRIRVRLARINCPEMSTPEGVAARDWTATWFGSHSGPYTLTTTRDRTDPYGRYLGDVAAADGHQLNDDLLAAGQAVPYPPSARQPVD